MNVAHIVGEHSSDRGISWMLLAASVVIAGIVCYTIYKRTHKTAVKEEIKRK